MLLSQLTSNHSINVWCIKLWELGRESPYSSVFSHGREQSSLPGFVPPYDMANSKSEMDIKPVILGGDWYQVYEFTFTW